MNVSCALATLSTASISKMFASKSIMIVGSSMTQRAYDSQHQGFGIGLSDWYSRFADVFLRGQSGYNTRWTLATLPDLIGPHKPDMAIIFLGNNDSITDGNGQSIPLVEFRTNMIAIMSIFRNVNPDIILLLLTPTRATKLGRVDSITAKYTDVIRELGAQNERTAVVDLWDGRNAIEVRDLCDGLHLNVNGNKKVLSEIKATITLKFNCMVPSCNDRKLKSNVEYPGEVNQSTFDSTDQITESKEGRQLQWCFPAWNILAGKSIDDVNNLIRLARIRSFL